MKYSIKKFFLFYLSLYTDEFKHLQTKKYKKQIKEFINSQKYGIFNKNESIKLSLKLHFPRSYRLFRDCKKKIKKRRNDRIDYKLNLQK